MNEGSVEESQPNACKATIIAHDNLSGMEKKVNKREQPSGPIASKESFEVKAYMTHVGSGPFPTEILGQSGDLLRFVGQEFGTTGRLRSCGWLDVVAWKYCCQINGFSSLNLTKLDVLSDLPEIQLSVAYNDVDGAPINYLLADLHILERLKVEYEVLPGWQADISSIRDYGDLPLAAQCFVERIDELVGTPIHYIGVGSGWDALVFK